MAQSFPSPSTARSGAKDGVLSIRPFRRLWQALSISAFGDWLGLLASTALAQQLAGEDYAKANFAIAGVFIVRLIPAVILGPLAGVFADRLDRKTLMVISDLTRFGLYLSIPIVGNYFWLYTATLLAETATLFWSPAKEATVPNLVPKNKLEAANQVQLLVAYGSAPFAAALFAILALFNSALSGIFKWQDSTAADIGLYINAFSFLYAAFVVYTLKEIPKGAASSKTEGSILKSLTEGWKFAGSSKIIRGLIVGIVGAFVAAGAVIGLARTFVGDLQAGEAAYGVLFGSVFAGLALGITLGPKILGNFSRRRIFGASLATAGLFLIVLSLIQNLVLAILVVLILGAFSGICWVTGFTMLGLEVEDELRGRTFAFVQSLIRVVLILVLAISPLIAAAIGRHTFNIYEISLTYNGAAFTMLLAGIIATTVGLLSYRQMRDRPGVSFFADIRSAIRGELGAYPSHTTPGFFIVFEGGEGSGKSTQTKILKRWFEGRGLQVTLTREPGGTELGSKLREMLLAVETGHISPRSEALLYAADRAHHVYSVVRPALERNEVVISDRYMDSSIAYQGAGRVLSSEEVARISRWATEGLTPHLTVILDQPASHGLSRIKEADRLESESIQFHDRVRDEYAILAGRDPDRYLVVDATQPIESIAVLVRNRIQEVAPSIFKDQLGGN
ncbi:MAG: dTMP kinase [Actinobacteria bacterium]|nr:dTMP kinase [Actinomycetota bacterium]